MKEWYKPSQQCFGFYLLTLQEPWVVQVSSRWQSEISIIALNNPEESSEKSLLWPRQVCVFLIVFFETSTNTIFSYKEQVGFFATDVQKNTKYFEVLMDGVLIA